jgi:hypothetical protein
VASIATVLCVWIVSGRWSLALSAGALDVGAKLFLYYGHERFWVWIRNKSMNNVTGADIAEALKIDLIHCSCTEERVLCSVHQTIAAALANRQYEVEESWKTAFADLSLGKHMGDSMREMRGWQALIALHDGDEETKNG